MDQQEYAEQARGKRFFFENLQLGDLKLQLELLIVERDRHENFFED